MPKQIKELRNFIAGTVSSPAASDIADEAAVYSKNLEPIDEQGKLKGCQEEVGKGYNDLTPLTFLSQNVQGNYVGGDKFEFYIADKKIDTVTATADQINTNLKFRSWMQSTLDTLVAENAQLTSGRVVTWNYGSSSELTFHNITPVLKIGVVASDIYFRLRADTSASTGLDLTGNLELFVGQYIKLDDEIIAIEEITNASEGIIKVARAQEDTVAADHSNTDTISIYKDYAAIMIEWSTQVDTPQFTIIHTPVSPNTKYTFDSENASTYFDIRARNMILGNKKMDDEVKTINNMIYYSIDDSDPNSPPAHTMKVIEDFYGDEGPPTIIDADKGGYVIGEPDSVSLAAGPQGTYVGTGGNPSGKSQWFGEIKHKRFGNAVSGYHLEGSQLEQLDEGQSLFVLDYIEHPLVGAASATPSAPTRSADMLLGTSTGKYNFIVMNTENTDPPGSIWGKQYKSGMIGIELSAVCSSSAVFMKMADTDLQPNGDTTLLEPFCNFTWNETVDASSSSLGGHGDNDTFYFWAADKYNANEIQLFAGRFFIHSTGNTPTVHFTHLRTWQLKHKIVTTSDMNLHYAAGEEILRPPKPGSYINDIFEKDGYVYIQYGHASGFSFDEEWLYVFNTDTSDTSGYQMENASLVINCKPITPAVVQTKNWGKSYHGSPNYDWWMPSEVFSGGGLSSSGWIGQCGTRGCYANYFKWRNTDMLGYVGASEDDHVSKNTSTGWKRMDAESVSTWSDEEPNKFPGWQSNNYGSSTPHVERNGGCAGRTFGPNFGFADYKCSTVRGGLTNYRDGTDIGIVAHIEGKQCVSGITMSLDIHKTESGFLNSNRKKRYSTTNVEEPIIKDRDEFVVLTSNKDKLGVRQRCVPKGSKYFRDQYYEYDIDGITITGSNNDSLTEAETHYILNGTYGDTWANLGAQFSGTGREDQTSATDDSAGNIIAAKGTFRPGTYYNLNDSSAGGDDYEDTTACRTRFNQHLYKLDQANSPQAGQSGNNVTNTSPINVGDIGSVSRNHDNTDWLFMTYQDPRLITSTYIGIWTKNIHQETDLAVDHLSSTNWSAGAAYNPLKFTDLGTSVMTDLKVDGTDINVTISPRNGDYIAGFAKWNIAGAEWTDPASDHVQHDVTREYFYKYPDSALDFGLDINFVSPNADSDRAKFKNGQTYYYKMSMLYDGFQEGPLTDFEFKEAPSGDFDRAQLTVRISDPPKRVSHLVVYRKNLAEEFYRMVAELPIASGWVYDTVKEQYKSFAVDEGKQRATYEAITGMPEDLKRTNINYSLSTVAQGHLFVADCYHPEIKQGQNFIFKSKANQFSNFEWSRDYCIMPTRPTHLTWWAGKIYVFDLSNIYRLNAATLVLEDTFEGIGCIGPDSCIVTDIGMFFADYQGMYWHNGTSAQNISRDILLSSLAIDQDSVIESTAADDKAWQYHNWQHITHNKDPQVFLDSRTQTVYFAFQDKHPIDGTIFNGAWKYSTPSKRWDLVEIPIPFGKLTGNRNDVYLSNQEFLYKISASKNARKKWSYHSKTYDMGAASQDKVFSSIKLVCNTELEAKDIEDGDVGTWKIYVDEHLITNTSTEVKDNVINIKITDQNKKGKKIKLELDDFVLELDSIAFLYRLGSIK